MNFVKIEILIFQKCLIQIFVNITFGAKNSKLIRVFGLSVKKMVVGLQAKSLSSRDFFLRAKDIEIQIGSPLREGLSINIVIPPLQVT